MTHGYWPHLARPGCSRMPDSASIRCGRHATGYAASCATVWHGGRCPMTLLMADRARPGSTPAAAACFEFPVQEICARCVDGPGTERRSPRLPCSTAAQASAPGGSRRSRHRDRTRQAGRGQARRRSFAQAPGRPAQYKSSHASALLLKRTAEPPSMRDITGQTMN